MSALPVNPQLTEEVRAPRKRQIPLNDNGEPVHVPAPSKLAPKKSSAMKATPPKAAPPKRKPSVEIEDVTDEDDTIPSQRPRNPCNIIEAADGSDDNDDHRVPPSAATSVDGDEEEEEAEIVEPAGEGDEVPNFMQNACPRNGLHLFTHSSKQLPKSSTRIAVVHMSSNAGPDGAKDVTVTTCTGSLTKVTQTRQVIFFVTQRFAGVLPRSRQHLRHVALKQRVRC